MLITLLHYTDFNVTVLMYIIIVAKVGITRTFDALCDYVSFVQFRKMRKIL